MTTYNNISRDIDYITGGIAPLFSIYQPSKALPKLLRTVYTRSRIIHRHAIVPAFAGFMTPGDKVALTPPGYDSRDMPDNFTDALSWRARKYLTRRWLVSLFFQLALIIVVCNYIGQASLAFDAPKRVETPMDLLLTLVGLVLALVGVVAIAIPPFAILAFLLRIILVAVKSRSLELGAQYWLVEGSPFDPVRWWTRRHSMLAFEDKIHDTSTIGQIVRVVLRSRDGAIVKDAAAYGAFYEALAPLLYNGGYVSGDDRLRMIRECDPTIISGGVASIGDNGVHVAAYVLGVGRQDLTELEDALRRRYFHRALAATAAQFPSVGDVRLYFEIDPEFYGCKVNSADGRRRYYEFIHD